MEGNHIDAQVDTQVDAGAAKIAAPLDELAQLRQHAANLEARIEGQESAIRQLSERNAFLLKQAHDHAVTLIAERLVHRAAHAPQRNAKHQPDSGATVDRDRLAVTSPSLDNPAAQTVLFHLELGQRKAELASLQAELSECQQRLSTSQAEAAARISDIQAESAERISALQADAARRIALMQGQLQQRDEQIAAFIRSSSWRLMRPFRVARRVVARLLSSARSSVAGTPTAAVTYAAADAGSNPSGARVSVTVASVLSDSVVTDAVVTASDFDVAYYLKRYPDVGKAQLDPYHHYLHFGKAEGRSGLPAPLRMRKTGEALSADKDYVLVVSHEATRTGAPILAWNICAELRHRYNVVVLLLGDGDILDYFDTAAHVVVGPYTPADRHAYAITPVIEALCKRYTFRQAIVNSIVSRGVLQPLAENFVPSVLLIHEFFNFFCSPDELVDAMAWAGRTVFSASMVRDSAAIERTRPAALASPIIPQGKSIIPAQPRSDKASARANALATLIANRKTKPFIVLGAGTVEYRKGVDLFVATAAEIKRRDPDADILMVWIGRVVSVYQDYADFIEEQVKQSGLKNRFELLGPTSDLEEIYGLADVCFISSRLDPLPNIAIDAMSAGLPVLCFEDATGVAENLLDDPLAAICVLPFLSVEEAARRITQLYREPATYAALSEKMRAVAHSRFDMQHYVEQLIDLGGVLNQAVSQEQQDIELLTQGDDFNASFYLLPESSKSREEAIREYVKSCQGRIYARKALPGFYPHVYAEHHDLTDRQINPLSHYLQAGKPEGPWQANVIDVSRQAALAVPQTLKVAVHLHVFYADMLTDLVERLQANEVNSDLYISVPSDAVARDVRVRLAKYKRGTHEIRIVPNRGRDIGPLLSEFADDLLKYDVIGHFHTKKSVHVVGSNLVRDWVDFLMQNLLGPTHRPVQTILAEFAANPKLGMVFADDPNSIGWDKNQLFGEQLAARMGIETLPTQFFTFAIGTMFWARPQALKPLFDLQLDWSEYPDEPLPIDGSMLHAIERLLPTIAHHAGFDFKVTYAPGVSR